MKGIEQEYHSYPRRECTWPRACSCTSLLLEIFFSHFMPTYFFTRDHKFIKRLLGWILVAGLSSGLVACDFTRDQFHAIDITGANYAKDFGANGKVLDQFGRPQSIANFQGKVVVVFFGFVQCPDVCPTTMAELAEAKKLLGDKGRLVQGVFMTVDPERDTPDILKPYAASFDPELLALHTSPENLATVAQNYKVYYKKVPGKTSGSYSMDHSAGSYIYDTKGQVRLYTRYGMGAKLLASDIEKLLP